MYLKQIYFKVILFSVFIMFTNSCSGQDCNNIDLLNKDYKEVITIIKKTNFSISEKINTDSSWIEKIEFYSCDEAVGFLIMTTKKNRKYIHKAVPVNLWYKFKNANSYGGFYTSNIKGRYQY